MDQVVTQTQESNVVTTDAVAPSAEQSIETTVVTLGVAAYVAEPTTQTDSGSTTSVVSETPATSSEANALPYDAGTKADEKIIRATPINVTAEPTETSEPTDGTDVKKRGLIAGAVASMLAALGGLIGIKRKKNDDK